MIISATRHAQYSWHLRYHKAPQQSLPTICLTWLHINYFCHGIKYQSISNKLCYIVLYRWDIFLSISSFYFCFVSYLFYRYHDFYWNSRHHRILVLYNGMLYKCTRINSRYVVLVDFFIDCLVFNAPFSNISAHISWW